MYFAYIQVTTALWVNVQVYMMLFADTLQCSMKCKTMQICACLKWPLLARQVQLQPSNDLGKLLALVFGGRGSVVVISTANRISGSPKLYAN